MKEIVSSRTGKSFVLEIGLALAALVIAAPSLAYLVTAYLNLDFWHDEINSLYSFVFVEINTIVTDYHVPNNHIFANLINHIYVYILGLDDISLIESPWKIRILMLTYTAITLMYAYMIGRNLFGVVEGIAIVFILSTTIPFLNFAVQVRGYSLSTMILSVVIYHSLRFYEKNSRIDGTMIVLGTCLLIYTIPSNIYITLSGILYWICVLWVTFLQKKDHREESIFLKRSLIIIILKAVGCIFAIILYTPVLSDVLNNRFVETKGPLNVDTLLTLMPQVLIQFLSYRWFLFITTIIGIIIFFRGPREFLPSVKIFLMPTMLFFPFILSAIRGDSPYDRTFVPLVVPFSVLFGVSFSRILKSLNGYKTFLFVIFAIFSTFASFSYTISEIDRVIRSDLKNGGRSQNILVNYHQRYYTPSSLMNEFFAQYEEKSIFIVENWVDEFAMPRYMLYWAEIYEKTIEKWPRRNNLYLREEWLESGKTIYVLTNKPDARQTLEERHPEIACTRITSPSQQGMVLRCVHRNLPPKPVTAQPDRSQPWVSLGKGWYPAEQSESSTYRWGSADNRIWLVNPYDTPIHVTLALTLESYDTARPVELWDGQRRLARWEVQRPLRTYRIGMTIAPGRTRLQLRAPTTYDSHSQRELSVVALKWRIANYAPMERR